MKSNLHDQDQKVHCNTVGAEECAGHLEFLVRNYDAVKAIDVEARIPGERDLWPRAVLLAFDNGRCNTRTYTGSMVRKYSFHYLS